MLFNSRQKARMHERKMHEGFKTKKRIRKRPTAANLEYFIVNKRPGQKDGMMIRYYHEGAPAVKDQQPIAEEESVETSEIIKIEAHEAGVQVSEVEEKQEDVLQKEFELVEVEEGAEGESFVIQECDVNGEPVTTAIQTGDKSFEPQVLEIPEDTEQCQLILYPDGTFKLLNILDAKT